MLIYLKKFFNFLGLDIHRHPSVLQKSKIRFYEIGNFDLILDVGANKGQFVSELRKEYKYRNQIISFEPLLNEFKILQKYYEADFRWKGFNFALGDFRAKSSINISRHSPSSSLLDFNNKHLVCNSNLSLIGTQEIKIETIDNIFEELLSEKNYENILLKIDTQGYDKKVLIGAKNSLNKIKGIYIELSIKELYKGESLFLDIMNFLEKHNFELYTLEPYYFDQKSFDLLQIEGYFLNKSLINNS
jgi:FkbM family methyltransferase